MICHGVENLIEFVVTLGHFLDLAPLHPTVQMDRFHAFLGRFGWQMSLVVRRYGMHDVPVVLITLRFVQLFVIFLSVVTERFELIILFFFLC